MTFERFHAEGRKWELLQVNTNMKSVEQISNFSVSGTERRLYIFGGIDKLGNPSGDIYSIETNTKQLLNFHTHLKEK